MQIARGLQQPPIALVAAGCGLLAGLLISLLPGHTGSVLLGAGLVLGLALFEPISALLILLLTSPLKALLLAEAPGVIPLEIGQLGIVLLVTSILIRHAVTRQPLHLKRSPVHAALGLFIAVALLSLPAAGSVTNSLGELLKWVEMALLISICLLLFSRHSAHWLVFALILAAAVQAVTGLYQFFGGSGAEHLRILDGSHFRAFGTFGQPNPYAAFLGLTLPLAVATAVGHLVRSLQALRQGRSFGASLTDRVLLENLLAGGLYALAAGLMLGGLVASWSRGAWMGIAGALVVVLFFLPRSLLQRVGLLLTVVVFVGLAWLQGLVPASITARMVGFVNELTSVTDVRGVYVTDENYAVTERIAHWQVAELIGRDNPWLWAGFDNYEVAYPAYALLEWQNPLGHAHNYYLNLAAEVGLLGLGAYLALWTAVVIMTLRVWHRSGGMARFWAAGLLGTWTYLSIHSLVDKLYVNNMFIQIGCLLGVLAILMQHTGERRA